MRRTSVMLLLAVILGGQLMSEVSAPATAQDQQGNFDIRVYLCTHDPGSVGLAMGFDPDECGRQAGVNINVSTEGGQFVGTCVTSPSPPFLGECAVMVRTDERLVVSQDITTLPPGYRPRENPILTRAYGEFSGAIFVNLPLDSASAAPPPLPVAQEHTASLTIHNRRCPLEYPGTDFYRRCHDNPVAGMSFFVEGPTPDRGQTDSRGNISFINLSPGAYEIWGGPPGDFVRNTMYCASADALGTAVPSIQTETTRLALDLTAGEHIICDWYSVPEDRRASALATPALPGAPPAVDSAQESLTIIGAICPQGYQGSAFEADCAAMPAAGAPYRIVHQPSLMSIPAVGFLTADAAGVAEFDLGPLGPGTINLYTSIPPDVPIPGGFTVPELRCLDRNGREFHDAAPIESRFTGQVFRIYIGPGEHPRCHVYFLPLAPSE